MILIEMFIFFFVFLVVISCIQYVWICISKELKIDLFYIVVMSFLLLVVGTVKNGLLYAKAQGTADFIKNQCGGEVTALTVITHRTEIAEFIDYCMTGTEP